MKPELYHKNKFALAEGPFWDDSKNCLAFVDVLGAALHFLPKGNLISHPLKSHVGAVVPCQKKNQYLCATYKGILFFDEADALFGKVIAHPEQSNTHVRYNDGKCDAAGRFYIGSMAYDYNKYRKAGSLYRIDRDLTVTKLVDNIGISNGLAWDYSLNKMYYNDSLRLTTYSFDYNPDDGDIKNKRVMMKFSGEGAPDGMSIDREGNLWIAMWGANQVIHVDPRKQKILQRISIPASQVSSCCFGGNDLQTLFITTARTDLNKAELKEEPTAGSIYSFKTKTQGFNTQKFGI